MATAGRECLASTQRWWHVHQSLLQEGQAALAPVSGSGQLRSLWKAAQVAVATTQHRQQATGQQGQEAQAVSSLGRCWSVAG